MAASSSRSPLKFFSLVFALSLPFWLAGSFTAVQWLPGLPVSSLMFVCPAAAALIFVYRENRAAGVAALLRRSFDYQRIAPKIWYAPAVLLMPALVAVSYGLMRWMGLRLPTPRFPLPASAAMLLAFLIAAFGEELGWSGYITGPMRDRWNALQTGILLGLVWAAWHLVPYWQAHRSPAWIAWQCLFTVAARVLLVWLYSNGGESVFAAALCHATANAGVFQFPFDGSDYDPRFTAPVTALAAAVVTAVWGMRAQRGNLRSTSFVQGTRTDVDESSAKVAAISRPSATPTCPRPAI